jgi:hypothetical protein
MNFADKGRWTERKLIGDDRPRIRYEYWVTGKGYFPLDMIRHDAAWPAASEDAAKLDSHWPENRAIRLFSYRKPTVDRWASFGWTVGDRAAEVTLALR